MLFSVAGGSGGGSDILTTGAVVAIGLVVGMTVAAVLCATSISFLCKWEAIIIKGLLRPLYTPYTGNCCCLLKQWNSCFKVWLWD